MGKIFTAECSSCNRLYNFDVGIGNIYSKDILFNINSDFNLMTLFKEKKRKEELLKLLNPIKYNLQDDYGHNVFICDTCKNLYSRFSFTILDDKNEKIFATKFRCHKCRKTLRLIKEDDLLHETFKCPNCNNDIHFHISGKWN